MTISFFLSSNREDLHDDQWQPKPAFHGYFLNKHVLAMFRDEWYPPGMNADSPLPDDVWNLMQLCYFVSPTKATTSRSFKQRLNLFGNKLSPSKMLAKRHDVFTGLHPHYAATKIDLISVEGESVGFAVRAPDWISACTVEGFLLAAMNIRPKVCPKHMSFHSGECSYCEQLESLRTWLRQLKHRGKISEDEKKACLRQAVTLGSDYAMGELRKKLVKEGKLRGYK